MTRSPEPSETALYPGHEAHLSATQNRRPAPYTHPTAANGSCTASEPEGWRVVLSRSRACIPSPSSSAAVTVLPVAQQSLRCSSVSFRSMVPAHAAARTPHTAAARTRLAPQHAAPGTPHPAARLRRLFSRLGPAPPPLRDAVARRLARCSSRCPAESHLGAKVP